MRKQKKFTYKQAIRYHYIGLIRDTVPYKEWKALLEWSLKRIDNQVIQEVVKKILDAERRLTIYKSELRFRTKNRCDLKVGKGLPQEVFLN